MVKMATADELGSCFDTEKADHCHENIAILTQSLDSFEKAFNATLSARDSSPQMMSCNESLKLIKAKSMPRKLSRTEILEWIQDYAKLQLDYTFIEEESLTDQDFPESQHAEEKLEKIFAALDEPAVLLQKLGLPDSSLDKEFRECILWRKGALSYYYCCTVHKDKERLQRNKKHFFRFAKEGVQYLKLMLRVRGKLQENRSQVQSETEDTFDLLKAGLLSSSHVLAVMYAGELCYYYISDKDTILPDWDKRNAASTGIELLEAYIKAVTGPLKTHGWDSSKALDMISELRTIAGKYSE